MNVGSLFSGIGGFDLGFERAGMRVAWQCEADPFCRRVLARHWPNVPCYPDVRDIRADAVESVDVLCGGFPCQDISLAGRGAGIGGERSGLWAEFARLIRDLRPGYVVVENVPALLARGLDVVLADLAACGYDAEWDCVPAAAVGAPHVRDRFWLVGYPQGDGCRPWRPGRLSSAGARQPEPVRAFSDAGELASNWWISEPGVGRVADGVPDWVDRTRALGNALVPQIAEWIGHRIIQWEGGMNADRTPPSDVSPGNEDRSFLANIDRLKGESEALDYALDLLQRAEAEIAGHREARDALIFFGVQREKRILELERLLDRWRNTIGPLQSVAHGVLRTETDEALAESTGEDASRETEDEIRG